MVIAPTALLSTGHNGDWSQSTTAHWSQWRLLPQHYCPLVIMAIDPRALMATGHNGDWSHSTTAHWSQWRLIPEHYCPLVTMAIDPTALLPTGHNGDWSHSTTVHWSQWRLIPQHYCPLVTMATDPTALLSTGHNGHWSHSTALLSTGHNGDWSQSTTVHWSQWRLIPEHYCPLVTMATDPKAISCSTASEANNVTPLTIKCITGQSRASSSYFLPLQLISQRTRSTTWKRPHYPIFSSERPFSHFFCALNAVHIPFIPHSGVHHSLLDSTNLRTLLQQWAFLNPQC
jgi:hypothetical protein